VKLPTGAELGNKSINRFGGINKFGEIFLIDLVHV
jgi:hypothetical protein